MADSSLLRLTDLELDALTELINIGVGRAAASLAIMCGDAVTLSVPAVSTVTPEQASEMVGGARIGKMVAVEQDYSGDVYGRALLIFPESNSLELVRAVSGDAVPTADIPAMAPEALLETGNVVLQSCLGTIANMLHRNLGIGTPKLVEGRARELFPRVSKDAVLFVYINFSLRGRRIRGYIALLMDLAAMAALKRLVAEFVERET
ncbi:chemotaxis protein CheC [Phenylobacterium sp. J426]|uniref:chemotaxis protein CheC n=1 Tax=Phenylobacterium sp. J426 TaxID=2898439 RepID=UPI00215094E8|nr:chemotaxis protein CheC [Phenylobacterium sp. J426]MCR5874537.1 chemotaxis protein CheC [Phenylobacterium sp. J426]